MAELLLATIVGLLLFIAVQLRGIRTAAQSIVHALRPRDLSGYDPTDDSEGNSRSILDQSAILAATSAVRLRQMEGVLRYLRNYTWEVADPRLKDEVLHPTKSTDWNQAFGPHEGTRDYGLWERERDRELGFSRAMSEAARESGASGAEPAT